MTESRVVAVMTGLLRVSRDRTNAGGGPRCVGKEGVGDIGAFIHTSGQHPRDPCGPFTRPLIRIPSVSGRLFTYFHLGFIACWDANEMPQRNPQCLEEALSRLVRPDCQQRLSLPLHSNVAPIIPATLPTYLLHAPALISRRRRMLKQLTTAGAPDLTLVTCANREDVEALSHADRACLFPQYVQTHWSKKRSGVMTNGTFSLGLKHQLAYLDIIRRGLLAAMILEDDSMVRRPQKYALRARGPLPDPSTASHSPT